MEYLEETLKAAVTNGDISGVVLACTNTTGSFTYTNSFGVQSLDDCDDTPINENTLLTLTSCTKIVTAIAILQVIEKGLIGLDDPIDEVLPELAALKILIAMNDGKPTFVERKNPMTLRLPISRAELLLTSRFGRLLSHSSGLVYYHMSPLLHSYIETLGLPPPPKTVVGSFSMPLVFEPGTSWAYSPGIDWAGLALARLTQTSLDTYLQQHVFGPIGIDDMTFWPDKTPALALRKSTLAMRDANGSGKAVPFLGPNPVAGATEELGGQGLFAPAKSYLKVLKSILTDDEVLLKKSSTALMFTPQLTAESQAVLQALYKSQPARGPCAVGEFPPDLKYDWGISGVLSLEDREKDGALVRRKGCLNWSGMLNLFWWIDRSAGLCGIFGTQIIPSGDKKVKEITSLFENTMYEQAALHAKTGSL